VAQNPDVSDPESVAQVGLVPRQESPEAAQFAKAFPESTVAVIEYEQTIGDEPHAVKGAEDWSAHCLLPLIDIEPWTQLRVT